MLDWVETNPQVAKDLFGKSQKEMANPKRKQTKPYKKPQELTREGNALEEVLYSDIDGGEEDMPEAD